MISFEQARQIAATSPEVLQWFGPGGVEIAASGYENSADYILTGRTVGEPWWHEIEDRPIPGPPMIVVSKATGEVRTFIGASVPDYENDEELVPIGDMPDDDGPPRELVIG
jgi:hypothetical protein